MNLPRSPKFKPNQEIIDDNFKKLLEQKPNIKTPNKILKPEKEIAI